MDSARCQDFRLKSAAVFALKLKRKDAHLIAMCIVYGEALALVHTTATVCGRSQNMPASLGRWCVTAVCCDCIHS